MIFKQIGFLILLLSFYSCGKSPLLMKKANEETQGQTNLESTKKFTTTGHSLELVWLSPINSTEAGHFLLITKINAKASDLPANFSLFLWMPSMGHGSSPVTIKKMATGVYDVTDVYFIMDGDWQMRIQLKNDSSVLEEIHFSYNI